MFQLLTFEPGELLDAAAGAGAGAGQFAMGSSVYAPRSPDVRVKIHTFDKRHQVRLLYGRTLK